MTYDIDLSSNDGRAEIFLVSEEPVRLESSNTYLQTVPVTGLTVLVDNRLDHLIKVREVSFGHPNWAEFVKGPDGEYRYPGGILPGQSFTIFWEPVRPAQHAGIKG